MLSRGYVEVVCGGVGRKYHVYGKANWKVCRVLRVCRGCLECDGEVVLILWRGYLKGV